MQPTEQGRHWEASGHSTTQILSVLCNPNEQCHAYKIQSSAPILSHMQNVHIVVAFFFPLQISSIPSNWIFRFIYSEYNFCKPYVL
jgi:hypothetical protein